MGDVCESGTLNIIFHGTFAFVKGNTQFNVLIPDVPDHRFVAGTYLHENELNRGNVYSVEGIAAAVKAPLISIANNICIREVPMVKDAAPGNLLFCQWNLPWPDRFRSIRDMALDATWFAPAESVKHNISIPLRLALLHVLSYRFDHSCLLRISDQDGSGFSWEPAFKDDNKTVNLHVFSDPDSRVIDSEKIPAFAKLMGLFALDVKLNPPPSTDPFVPPPLEYPEIPGLEEVLELRNIEARGGGQVKPPYSCSSAISLPPPQTSGALFM